VRTLGVALVRGELLTQGEIFQDERLSMDEEAAQEANEQSHPGILAGAGKSNDLRLDGAFADYDRLSGELGGSHSKPPGGIANNI
jgi:hypothetical protein